MYRVVASERLTLPSSRNTVLPHACPDKTQATTALQARPASCCTGCPTCEPLLVCWPSQHTGSGWTSPRQWARQSLPNSYRVSHQTSALDRPDSLEEPAALRPIRPGLVSENNTQARTGLACLPGPGGMVVMSLTPRLPVRGSAARSHSLLVTAHRAWWVTVLERSASPIAPLLCCKGLGVLGETRHSLG
jgi:hypothetical protein